ncbi:hypothetical protein BH23CHL7_BH23CHL7_06380 [soil metagenome]
MELRHVLRVIRAWFLLLIACTVLGGGGGYVMSQMTPPTYESRATLIVGHSLSSANPDFQQLQVAQRLSQTYAEVARTRPVLQRVIERLNLQDVSTSDLRQAIAVEAVRDINLIRITASSQWPEAAADIANALAAELVAASPSIQGQQREIQEFLLRDVAATQRQIDDFQAEVDRLLGLPNRSLTEEERLETLQGRLAALRQTYASLLSQLASAAPNRLTVVEPAVPASGPSAPRTMFNTALGAMLGLIVALALAFIVDHLDDTLTNSEEVEALAALPTLGHVAQLAVSRRKDPIYRLVSLLFPRSPAAESFRSLRTNIEFCSVDSPLRTVLVASAAPGDGKTLVAANLAVVLAQAGKKVLVVDADLRRPSAHLMFNLPNTHGLTTMLRSADASTAAGIQTTEVRGLSVLASGPIPPNPAELLGSDRMRTLLKTLTERYDLIILDSSPLSAVTDAAVLASAVDGTLLVVKARRTRRPAMRFALEALSRVNARVLGVVLNGVGKEVSGAYQDYYGQSPVLQEPPPARSQPAPRSGR